MMRTKSQFSRNVYAISDRIWYNKHLKHTTTEKYDNNGKGWYLRFDDDNNMSYKYILSITWPEMCQLNTYNPIYFNDKCNREDHNRSNTTYLKSRLPLSDHISGR